MYDPFNPQPTGQIQTMTTPNAVNPGTTLPPLSSGGGRPYAPRPPRDPRFPDRQPMNWLNALPEQFRERFEDNPNFQQYQQRMADRQAARGNALGPITPPGPGNLPPNPQSNPALPPQAIPPLPPQAAPYQGFGESYPQGYPQYGKLWG